MKISLNPSYFCNFRCSFCYLTESQLGSKTRIDVARLDEMLAEIDDTEFIEAVDVYGGEVSFLPDDYWYEIKAVIRKYYNGSINVITNLSRVPKWFLDDDITLSISYDFDARQSHISVRNNILSLEKDFSVLVLASEKLLSKDTMSMINELNTFSLMTSVEIKPYSKNQSNQDNVGFEDYEQFVRKWLELKEHFNFEFMNEFLLEDVRDGFSHSFSDNHIYITPDGDFGVLEFDDEDNEFFETFKSFDHYWVWVEKEKARVSASACAGCNYFGKCLSEHLRHVDDLSKPCNGFKGLIDWFINENVENPSGDASSP